MARKSKKHSIRCRILKSLINLIAVIFFIIVILFNLLVNRYIEKSAKYKLENIKFISQDNEDVSIKEKFPDKEMNTEDKKYIHIIKRVQEQSKQMGSFSDIEMMVIDSQYKTLFPKENDDMLEDIDKYNNISYELKEDEFDLDSNKIVKIQTENGYYYVCAMNIIDYGKKTNEYLIFFIDISMLMNLAVKIDILLCAIMRVAGVFAIATSIILSRKIAEPIQKLSLFAHRIGEGDFKQCDYDFSHKELNELLDTMNTAAKYLDEYDKEQKIFFQNVSHELRTPLMSIKGYAEGIKYGLMDKNSASDIILEEGNRLGELIEELLYVSKMDNITKDYVLVERDLREILSDCALKQKAIAVNRGLEFKFKFDENPVLLVCDEKSVYRAFSNIINNSIRYADKTITLTCRNEEKNKFISIENDGENINEKDLTNIFERFYKGNKGKHGIGLSIVKSVINKHDGVVYAENIENGVRFIVKF